MTERYSRRRGDITPRFVLQAGISEGETVAETTVDEAISKANDRGKQAVKDQQADERIAKQELRKRKTEEIKSIPPLPLCPGLKKLGAALFTEVNDKDGAAKAVAAWSWWKQVATDYPGRIYCYVGRLYPIKIEKPKGERSEEKIYDFPEYEFAPEYPNLEAWVLQRYGSGNYKFYFNDAVLGGALCQWHLNGVKNEKFPPIINPSDVDLTHPSNASFVDELRRRKLIDGWEENKVAGELTNVQAIAQQQNQQNQPLTAAIQTIASMAKEGRASQVDPSVVAESIGKSYAKVLDTAMDAMQRTREMETKRSDPSDHVDQLIKVATLITPKAPPPVDVAAIMRESRESQAEARKASEMLANELRDRDREDRKAMRDEIRELKQRPPEDPFAGVDKLITLGEKLKGLAGLGKDEDEGHGNGKEPWWADIAKAVIPAVAPLVGLAVQAGVKYLGSSPQQQQVQQQPGMVQQPQQITQPQQQEQQPMTDEQKTQILWSLIGGKMQYDYQSGKTGIDFACWLIDQHHLGLNQTVYSQDVASKGRDAIIASMQMYAPAVWQNVSADGKPQPAFELFLADFLDQQAVAQARGGGAPVAEEESARTPEIVEDLPRVKRVRTMPKGGVA